MPPRIADRLDFTELAPLRLRARTVADGVLAGAHRSARRGAGIEFAGHRAYCPGDELRFVDVRASLRQGRVLVRQFQTETERALRLVIDATQSMAFRSAGAKEDKLSYASLLAAATARIALASSDPVGLDWIGGMNTRYVPASSAVETFERLLAALEGARAGGDARQRPELLTDGLGETLRAARRGSAVLLFSDLIDLPDGSDEAISSLGLRGRTLVVVAVLDDAEADFPFEGPVRLRASEVASGDAAYVQTDGSVVRAAYLERLEARLAEARSTFARHGGQLVVAKTSDDPVTVVRAIVAAFARQGPAASAERAS